MKETISSFLEIAEEHIISLDISSGSVLVTAAIIPPPGMREGLLSRLASCQD